MKIRETTREDLDFMADNSISRGIVKNQPDRIEFCYSLEHEGKLLGMGGIRMINLTTAWCWIDMSHNAGGHIIAIYRVIKEWMYELVEDKGIKRLQAYVVTDFPEAVRMVQHLGFEKESILKNFMGDKDAYLYVRLF